MNARLGFAIAANLEPDALIIDEVLAVGDMAFQQRCLDRMRAFKQEGVAIVFVSHNLQAVAALCDRALWIQGSTKRDGTPSEVVQAYSLGDAGSLEAPRREAVQITSAVLIDRNGRRIDEPVASGTNLTLRVSYLPRETVDEAICDFLVYRSADNLLLYEGHFSMAEVGLPHVPAEQPFVIDFPFRTHLAAGDYRVATRLRDTIMLRFLAEVCPPNFFTVAGTPNPDRIGQLYFETVPSAANIQEQFSQ